MTDKVAEIKEILIAWDIAGIVETVPDEVERAVLDEFVMMSINLLEELQKAREQIELLTGDADYTVEEHIEVIEKECDHLRAEHTAMKAALENLADTKVSGDMYYVGRQMNHEYAASVLASLKQEGEN